MITKTIINEDEKFKILIKNSFDMIVLLDENGVQHYVSESCQRILGYKPEELTGIKVIEEMIHPEDREHTRQGLIDIIHKTGNGGAHYRHRHKNGSWVYLEAFGSNQLDNPLIQSVILNVRDITERKVAEQALKESETYLSELNTTKDRFFSIIAHDLRNPFIGILGLSEVLVNDMQDENYQNALEYGKLIQDSAQKATNLINNLLQWANAQSGQIKCTPQHFDLHELVEESIDIMKFPAREKGISIRHEILPGGNVFADREMLLTVFRNLISNSIKFTSSGGEICISGEEQNGLWRVSVRDTGVGISPKNLEKLFRIEYVYSTVGTEEETGTGLGLLLCKEFIEKHNGKIWAESDPEIGSTFHFTLPNRPI